jgi:DNA-binding ferritin-like protein
LEGEPRVAVDESGGAIPLLNQALSELIDLVLDVKQARQRVPRNHELHSELDQLFVDLKRWAEAFVEADEARGVSPLDKVPGADKRTPENLWPSEASDNEVRVTLAQHLEVLSKHMSDALDALEGDEAARDLLGRFRTELGSHIQRLTPSE